MVGNANKRLLPLLIVIQILVQSVIRLNQNKFGFVDPAYVEMTASNKAIAGQTKVGAITFRGLSKVPRCEQEAEPPSPVQL